MMYYSPTYGIHYGDPMPDSVPCDETHPAYKAPVPSQVSMYQAQTALLRAGLLSTVEAELAAMPGQAGEEARIKWAKATDVRREDALVVAMAGILNLDSAGLDSLFTTASEII